MGDGVAERRERFEAVYRELYAPICGYALRRLREPEDAAEVIAETFATLWRRFDACPQGDELRPWLFGVARRVIANQRRGERRRSALGERLAADVDQTAFEAAHQDEATSELARAFAALNESDRELLSLVAWEGLTSEELSIALGTTHRSKSRFTGGEKHEWT